MSATQEKLAAFEALGFAKHGEVGEQTYGECIFCGKETKFYINTRTGEWDCKVCGAEGNLYTFLNKLWEMCKADTQTKDYAKISQDRGIPITWLKKAGLVFFRDKNLWLLPVRNEESKIISFRLAMPPRYKSYALAGLGVHLYGLETLYNQERAGEPVYVCEGEWDALALRVMLFRDNEKGIAVAVPGANMKWQDRWLRGIGGRDIVLCFDNDKSGKEGAEKAAKSLEGVARSIRVLTWPEGLPDGFDIRDLHKSGGGIDDLAECIGDNLLGELGNGAPDEAPPCSFAEAAEVFKRYLKWTAQMEDELRIAYAVALSPQMPGEPLWVYIVGPPGCGKTVILESMDKSPNCVYQSSITARTLLSGYAASKDPSLIPRLIGKTFVLKDFTEVLDMPRTDRDEVFAVLRGAFDGKVERDFGNNVKRVYHGKFAMLAGVTNAIYGNRSTSLGERFLIYNAFADTTVSRREIVRAAMAQFSHETAMREELARISASFLKRKVDMENLPHIPPAIMTKIEACAMLLTALRASVERDQYTGRIRYIPDMEVATRAAKQLQKLAYCLALVEDSPTVTEKMYRLVARVTAHTCSDLPLLVFNTLIKAGEPLTRAEIAARTNLSSENFEIVLKDMEVLNVVRAAPLQGLSREKKYRLSQDYVAAWREAEISEKKHGMKIAFKRTFMKEK